MEEISSFLRLTPCGIFHSPSSTGVRRFPLRFDFPIQKARYFNQEGTKVETNTNTELGSYAKKGDLAFRLTMTEHNFTLKACEPGLNARSFKGEISFFVRYSLFSPNVRKNPEL
nr:hypothetical protein [Alkalicoccus halolimnae]TXF85923.1 hypothetical protein FTX54_07555 [Alkalicoccus halolimnae]